MGCFRRRRRWGSHQPGSMLRPDQSFRNVDPVLVFLEILMRRTFALTTWCLGGFGVSIATAQAPAANPIHSRYQATADRLIDGALKDSSAWNQLAELADRFGNRLSGSAALEQAIDWVLDEMKKDGLENVRGEPAMVPHWVRGRESAELVQPRNARLPMLGLGGSVGTPKDGIAAEVLVVSSFDDLHAHAADAKGKIVLFDVPFTNYGQTVQYRGTGAIEASKAGAVASMIRSVGPFGMRTPHTGAMRYDSVVPKIPHFAITMEDAAMLHRMQSRGQTIVVRVTMEAETLPDAPSRNVVGEIVGREKPTRWS